MLFHFINQAVTVTKTLIMFSSFTQAIVELGEVLQFYDSDKRFPAWGFGARPIDGPVSHCFNLNGSSSYCEVKQTQCASL